MLNFKESKDAQAIAIIDGGQYGGNIVWLHENTDLSGGCSPMNPSCLINPIKGFKQIEIGRIHEAIKKGYASPEILADPRLSKIYNTTNAELLEKQGREIRISSGKFSPLPMNVEGQRQVIQLGAPSGAGKSFLAAQYAKNYHTLWPDRPILLFSRKNEDKAFDKLDYVKRVDLESLIDNRMEPDELAKSCLIFDDIETLDEPYKTVVYQLKDDMLNIGRSYEIVMLLCTHITMAGNKTKQDNNESTDTVLFKHGNSHHNRRMLKEYIGLDNKTIEKILAAPSRWMWVHKHCPMYVLTENEVFLL